MKNVIRYQVNDHVGMVKIREVFSIFHDFRLNVNARAFNDNPWFIDAHAIDLFHVANTPKNHLQAMGLHGWTNIVGKIEDPIFHW